MIIVFYSATTIFGETAIWGIQIAIYTYKLTKNLPEHLSIAPQVKSFIKSYPLSYFILISCSDFTKFLLLLYEQRNPWFQLSRFISYLNFVRLSRLLGLFFWRHFLIELVNHLWGCLKLSLLILFYYWHCCSASHSLLTPTLAPSQNKKMWVFN